MASNAGLSAQSRTSSVTASCNSALPATSGRTAAHQTSKIGVGIRPTNAKFRRFETLLIRPYSTRLNTSVRLFDKSTGQVALQEQAVPEADK